MNDFSPILAALGAAAASLAVCLGGLALVVGAICVVTRPWRHRERQEPGGGAGFAYDPLNYDPATGIWKESNH